MPRLATRRKAATASTTTIDETIVTTVTTTNINNNAIEEEPKSKIKRLTFQLPLPERARVVGRALVCGQGEFGQLGLGDDQSKLERKRPALVEQVTNVVDVVAGGMHNLVLTHDGRVFTFGCNDEGALGRDTTEDGSEFEPRPIELPGRALKISAGDSHSACLLEDGRVFAWGSFRDSHGSMGLTLEGNKRLPIDVLAGVVCCDIASGADHLVILTSVGKVFTVGCGEQGQLGRVSLRSASGEGRRGKTELLQPGQVIMKRAKPIEAIWGTNYCTFLRESQSGTIWAFGLNNYKQLTYAKDVGTIINPINMKFNHVQQIAGGQHHTLVLKTDGTVYAIGRSHYGRLGLGALDDDVTELTPIPAFKGKAVASVSCGEATSFALTQDGLLYAWGMGSNHQLGTGTDTDVSEPTLIVSKQTEGKRIIKASGGGQHSIFLVENELQPANVLKNEVMMNKKNSATKKAKAAKNTEDTTSSKTSVNNVVQQVSNNKKQPKNSNTNSTSNNNNKVSEERKKGSDVAVANHDNDEELPKRSEEDTSTGSPPAKRGRKKKA